MNVIGLIMAVLLFAGIVIGVGFGAFTGYEFLSAQLELLNQEWRAILVIIASLLIFCTLFVSFSIRSAIKKYGINGTGRAMAYNDFTHWYSAIKSGNSEAMKAETLKALLNQMLLWSSKQVGKQMNLLHELLQQDEVDRDQVLEKAEHVYLAIRSELGLRGTSEDSAIV